jgi:hypothetical protein
LPRNRGGVSPHAGGDCEPLDILLEIFPNESNRGVMGGSNRIDYTRLLGFSTISEPTSGGIDFRDETVGARIGAKVGIEPTEPAQPSSATE